MKSNTICQVILAGSIILASCQSNNSAKQDESQQTMNETVMNKVTDCKISAGNITFTNATSHSACPRWEHETFYVNSQGYSGVYNGGIV